MKTNEDGVNLIKQFEGCRLKAYLDPIGILTIGYGHTGPEVVVGLEITQGHADNLLYTDLHTFEYTVEHLLPKKLNTNQFSALICFAYNVGAGNLAKSTLLKLVNLGDYAMASLEFPKWNHAGGRVLAGLTRRRIAEKQLFEKECVIS